MATILEQEEKDQQGPTQLTGGIVGSAPTTSPMASNAPAAPEQKGSGRAVNLRQYVEANQGAGQKLGQGIQQQAQQTASQAQKGISDVSSKFQQQSTPLEQQLGEQGQSTIQTAFKTPEQLLQNQQQLQQFQTLRNQGLNQQIGGLAQDTSSIQKQVQGLQENVGLAGSEGGRFQLLQRTFGQPDYSKGQQRLDQLFLQASPVRDLQKQLGEQAKTTSQALTGTETSMQDKIAALMGMSGQRAEEANKLLYGGASEGIESELGQRGITDIAQDVEARRKQAEQTGSQRLEQLLGNIGKDQFSQEDLAAFGIDPGSELYNIDLSNYISQQPRSATMANIANPEEFSRYQALRQLAGGADADVFGGATADELGGYSPYEINKESISAFLNPRTEQVKKATEEAGTQLYKEFNPEWMDTVINDPNSPTSSRNYYKAAKELATSGYSPESAMNFVKAFESAGKSAFGGLSSAKEIAAYNKAREVANLYKSLNLGRFANPQDLESGGNFNV